MLPNHPRPPERAGLRTWLAMAVVAGATLAGTAHWLSRRAAAPRFDLTGHPHTRVLRQALHASLRAPGRIESQQRTLIECEAEALSIASRGRSFSTNGSTTILTIIPAGTMVEKGQVLCELDGSEYEELVRQQRILVDQARADHSAARLDLESDEITLREYSEGLLAQQREGYEGRARLAQADAQRQRERLDWTRKMADIGYLPRSRVTAEASTLDRVVLDLSMTRRASSNLDQFVAPRTIITLESRIAASRSVLAYQELRLARSEERLSHFQRQVEICTVRAPHDGFVIYANEDDGDTRIEPGARVRQKQDLFYLPDLNHMEVQTLLHQSVVDRVREGQTATVKVEALPGSPIEGHVVAVSPLPETSRNWRLSDEARNFTGRVELHSIPDGLRPGMTAEVELRTASVADALVIPHEALAIEGGQQVCYVIGPQGPQRRLVQIGEGTLGLLQVQSGLDEGDEVLLDPEVVAEGLAALAERGPAPSGVVVAGARPPL